MDEHTHTQTQKLKAILGPAGRARTGKKSWEWRLGTRRLYDTNLDYVHSQVEDCDNIFNLAVLAASDQQITNFILHSLYWFLLYSPNICNCTIVHVAKTTILT